MLLLYCTVLLVFFFFKQKTAYEMRISDWSSDVCSSDLIANVWYYPREDYSYDETGIASWYGPGFHGKITANGELYDQDAMTAAHRTLPMPSLVQVTNLENGQIGRAHV